jgi:hypothetical protein
MNLVEATLSPALIGGLAAAIAVPRVLALIRKSGKYQYVGDTPTISDQRIGWLKKWDLYARLLCIPIAGAFTYVLWLLLSSIEGERTALLGSADFVLTPIPVFFFTPALFGGLLLTAIPLKIVLSKILGKEGYEQLENYSDSRMRINSKRLSKHLVYVIAPVVVVSVVLAIQTYAVVDSKGFTIHPFFATHERHYGWTDISRVRLIKSFKAPNGNIIRDRPYYVIETADGFSLNFHKTILEIPFRDQNRLAGFVADHALLRDIQVEDPFR